MTEYRIESIALKNIGVFDEVKIDFPPIESTEADQKKAEIHLFTGANGCGKSTLLYALASIFDKYPADNDLLAKRFRQDDYAVININFNKELIRFNQKTDVRLHLVKEYYFEQSKILGLYHHIKQNISLIDTCLAPIMAFAYSGRRTLENISTHSIENIQKSPFENALSFTGNTDTNLIAQWILNSLSSAALAEVEGDKQAAQNYQYAVKQIEEFIFDICQLEIKFKIQRSPLTVKISLNNRVLDFEVLPDGLKSVISWVADLAVRLDSIPWAQQRSIFDQNIILFLDEIDIHLHPKWQRRILPAVQKLLPNAQIFASTHSPFVVGSVEDAWIYKLPEQGEKVSEIKAIKSNPAKSYALILNEIFDIDKDFGEEIEQDLNQFYQYRQSYMNNKQPADKTQLLAIAAKLFDKGEEVKAIVARELRQLSRLMNEDIDLA
ncbi:AAA family ATPase [Agitococcus lubricus]|nr:AAA family ATPase [Agitococcus lubricus]